MPGSMMLPFDGGGGYAVDPNVVFTASTQFLDTKEFVFNIALGLAGDLSGSGGMAGGDKAGHAFSTTYQPAAQAVVAGIDKAGQGMAAISSRLLTMAVNYLETENVISKSLGSTHRRLLRTEPADRGVRAGRGRSETARGVGG